MPKLNVGVLRGGVSSEYDVSLKTGGSVLSAIPSDKYVPYDILIAKDGGWHMNGFPTSLEKISKTIDVVFNGLHGTYGEDGGVQRDLERFNIAYTGSAVFSSALAMNKVFSKEYFKKAGIKTPRGMIVREDEDVDRAAIVIFQKLSSPYIVKPFAGGSSIGVSAANTFEELVTAIHHALAYSQGALIEERISGREITCGVVDGQKPDSIYALAPIEVILPKQKELFDYSVKYGTDVDEVCPAHISENRQTEIKDLAMRAHKALGLRHYSRSDFIISPRGTYLLETNSLPGLAERSLLPKALKAADIAMPEFIDHVLTLALIKK